MQRWRSRARRSRTANRASNLQETSQETSNAVAPTFRAYRVKSVKPYRAVSAARPSAPPPYTQARRGPLLQHLAAKAKQCRGPSAGLCRHHAGGFDQRAGFHQPAKILLVKMPSRDRFHGPLQLSKCEFGRQKFKYHRTVFQFGAQPRNRGRQYSPVVEAHRYAKRGNGSARQCRGASVASRFLDQSRFVKQLITVEHALLVPMRALGAEIQPDAILAAECTCRVGLLGLLSPVRQFGKDVALDHAGPRFPPVFPWEVAIPGLKSGAKRPLRVVGRTRKREIADRGDMGIGVAGLRVPAAVAECIELLDVTQPQSRLFFHPGAQADLEGAVRNRVERAERESGEPVAVAARCGEYQRLVAFDRNDGRGEADFDRRQKFFVHLAPIADISRDRGETAGLRSSGCPDPFRRGRAASAHLAPKPGPPGSRSTGSATRSGRRRESVVRSRFRRDAD